MSFEAKCKIIDGHFEFEGQTPLQWAREQDDGDFTITITKNSTSQGRYRYYWAHIIRPIAKHTGHTEEEIHVYLKQLFLGYMADKISINGVTHISRIPSTRNLTGEQWHKYVESCKAMALNLGLAL